MRYTHLDQIVELYRDAFHLIDYNPRVTNHTHVLDVRHESFTRVADVCDWKMIMVTIEDEKYTCFANDMNDQLHIIHEPSEHYEPLKPFEEPWFESLDRILKKTKP